MSEKFLNLDSVRWSIRYDGTKLRIEEINMDKEEALKLAVFILDCLFEENIDE